MPPSSPCGANVTTDKDLSGQWALVTGAAKRIGAAIARGLHEAGANVAIHYMSSAGDAEALVAELDELRPDSAFAVQADLRDSSTVAPLMEAVLARTGRLDVLVNNASSFYPTPLASITEAQWDELIGSNLKAPLFLCQAALPQLVDARGVIRAVVRITLESVDAAMEQMSLFAERVVPLLA